MRVPTHRDRRGTNAGLGSSLRRASARLAAALLLGLQPNVDVVMIRNFNFVH